MNDFGKVKINNIELLLNSINQQLLVINREMYELKESLKYDAEQPEPAVEPVQSPEPVEKQPMKEKQKKGDADAEELDW